jgi:hypothetical protein
MQTRNTFYGTRYWGLRYHATYTLGGRQYTSQGLDLEHGTHVAIPALRGGRIVARGYTPILGRYITVEVGPEEYDTYIHVTRRVLLRKTIATGKRIAVVAGPQDPHGTAWTAPHLALHTGPHLGSALGVGTTNPETVIRKALKLSSL